MATKPKSYRVGPGTLKLGATGTSVDYSQQVMECTVAWDKDKDDDVPVLSGATLAGDASYTASLKGKVAQDLIAGGLVDTTWTKKGTTVPFEYTPATAEKATVKGDLVIDPLDIGGEVKKRGEAEFEWSIVGEPTLTFGS